MLYLFHYPRLTAPTVGPAELALHCGWNSPILDPIGGNMVVESEWAEEIGRVRAEHHSHSGPVPGTMEHERPSLAAVAHGESRFASRPCVAGQSHCGVQEEEEE